MTTVYDAIDKREITMTYGTHAESPSRTDHRNTHAIILLLCSYNLLTAFTVNLILSYLSLFVSTTSLWKTIVLKKNCAKLKLFENENRLAIANPKMYRLLDSSPYFQSCFKVCIRKKSKMDFEERGSFCYC